ncbi:MAG TPA: hypothetical protein VIC05_08585 [Solirubrobacteraceae bacterium]|jgi:hypothetical protein
MSQAAEQGQGITVTVLPNGHNEAVSAAPYTPSAYHGYGAVGLLVVLVLVLATGMLASLCASVRCLLRTGARAKQASSRR